MKQLPGSPKPLAPTQNKHIKTKAELGVICMSSWSPAGCLPSGPNLPALLHGAGVAGEAAVWFGDGTLCSSLGPPPVGKEDQSDLAGLAGPSGGELLGCAGVRAHPCPRLLCVFQERKLCAHPRIEIYKQDRIYFVCPLARQGDFYVPEMKELERKSRSAAAVAEDAQTDITGICALCKGSIFNQHQP